MAEREREGSCGQRSHEVREDMEEKEREGGREKDKGNKKRAAAAGKAHRIDVMYTVQLYPSISVVSSDTHTRTHTHIQTHISVYTS